MASDPVFGAVEKLTSELAKASAAADIARMKFGLALQSEQARQETEMAKLKAGAEAANAQQAPPPLDIGKIFKEQPIQPNRPQLGPSSVSDAIAATGVGGVQGGAAVQQYLKGGGGAATQASADIGAAGIDPTRQTVTTNEGFQQFDTGPYGRVVRPVTTRQTVTEPNTLTAAQAAQLAQSERQDVRRLALDERRAALARADQQRRDAANLTLQTVREFPGITPGEASAGVRALLAGDPQRAFEAFGRSVGKLNAVYERKTDLELQRFEAELENLDLRNEAARRELAGAIQGKGLGELAGLPVVGKPFTSSQLATTTKSLFNEDGDFDTTQIGTLQTVQAQYLNRGQLFLVREGGTFSGDSRSDAVPVQPFFEDLVRALGAGDDRVAAQEALRKVRVAGEPLFAVTREGLGPAVDRDDPNYAAIDGLIKAASYYQKTGQATGVFPQFEPQVPTDVEEDLALLQEAEAGLAALAQARAGAGPAQRTDIRGFPSPSGPIQARTPGKPSAKEVQLRERVAALRGKLDKRRASLDREVDQAQAQQLEAGIDEILARLAETTGAP